MATRADELIMAARRFAEVVPANLAFAADLAMTCRWGARDVREPLLPSGVSHRVPWGLSIAIERSLIEPRLFVEAQAEPASPATYWRTAAEVTRFAAGHGANLDRLDAMLDGLAAPFRLWHAVALGDTPRWHAYLCIPPDRPEAAHAALRRAGVTDMPPLRPRDRISMVSLDLTEVMRVKAYVLMPEASLDELAIAHDRARGALTGDAQRFGRAMLDRASAIDGHDLRDERRIWWLAAHGYTSSGPPTSCALHFGVPRHVDEPTAITRVRALLDHHVLPRDAWEHARAMLGSHHFVTFQRRDGEPRVTTYFLPQVER